MKKMIVATCAAIASAVALATTVESSNTFGVLKVDTGISNHSATNQFFFGVPWIDVGGSAQSINATNLVLASKLGDGDMLYVYGGAASAAPFGAWTVLEGEWSNAGASLPGGGTTVAVGTNPSVVRGAGVLVETSASAIYLSGQYSSAQPTVTIAGKSGGTPGYTMIGGGFAKNYDLNDSDLVGWTGGPSVGDLIILNDGKILKYYGSAEGQGWKKTQGANKTDATLAIGCGGWYMRNTEGNMTVTFK